MNRVMPKEEPFDESLFLVQKILASIEENFYNLVNLKQLSIYDSELDELEKKVDIFVKESQEMIEKMAFTENDLDLSTQDAQKALQVYSDALKKIENLLEKASYLKRAAEQEQGIIDETPPPKPREAKKLSKREHLKKYKGLRRPSDWT